MKLIKLIIFHFVFIFLFISCSLSNDSNNLSDSLNKTDTTYFSNGKVKSIISLLNGHKYGYEIQYDSLGHIKYNADYINDTLDGKEYVHNADDYGIENFYEMGKRKMTARTTILLIQLGILFLIEVILLIPYHHFTKLITIQIL